ncbi:hypothetical protein SDC9_134118 [bioreactor metagenome]|uniref:Uncharacterized protein n=1 Tax=bioreactor metagenome TaxID=1076179 RepID=A0A645DCV5_9ZZZZ
MQMEPDFRSRFMRRDPALFAELLLGDRLGIFQLQLMRILFEGEGDIFLRQSFPFQFIGDQLRSLQIQVRRRARVTFAIDAVIDVILIHQPRQRTFDCVRDDLLLMQFLADFFLAAQAVG